MDISPRSYAIGIAIALIGLVGLAGIATGVFDEPLTRFEESFEQGLIPPAKWQIDDDGTCAFQTVTDPVRSGKYSLQIKSRKGGRCEVLPWVGSTVLGRLVREPFNDDRWYEFSVYLPEDWEPHSQNEVIAQWHGSKDVFFGEKGGRGPPLALRIVDSEWRVTHGSDADLVSGPGAKASHIAVRRPIATGQWTDWRFHVKWSWEDDGRTEVWMDGEQVVNLSGANAYNDFRGVYLKMGNYHPGVNRTIYLDAIAVDSEKFSLHTVERAEL